MFKFCNCNFCSSTYINGSSCIPYHKNCRNSVCCIIPVIASQLFQKIFSFVCLTEKNPSREYCRYFLAFLVSWLWDLSQRKFSHYILCPANEVTTKALFISRASYELGYQLSDFLIEKSLLVFCCKISMR